MWPDTQYNKKMTASKRRSKVIARSKTRKRANPHAIIGIEEVLLFGIRRGRKTPKRKDPKSFQSMNSFMRHYFPEDLKRKRQGVLIVIPRPSVGP